MSRKILINVRPYETRAALLENGELTDLFYDSDELERFVGCIYKGRVSKVIKGTQSAFVSIGQTKDAYLTLGGVENLDQDDDATDIYRSPIQDVLKVGQEVILQILKEPAPNKGPRSTMSVSLPGRFLVLTPTVPSIGVSRRISQDKERERLRAIGQKILPKGMGVIFRTAAEGQEEDILVADISVLCKLWEKIEAKARKATPPALVHRDIPLPLKLARDFFSDNVEELFIDSEDEYRNILDMCDFLTPLQRASMEVYRDPVPLFEKHGIEHEIRNAIQRKVWLESGGYVYFDRTEALTTIDVNSGRFSGGQNLEETVFKVNLEAARVIARQIRLRNLSGMLIIDFIDMEDRTHKQKVLRALKDGFRTDRNRPYVIDFSELGLVQMTRRRTSFSLDEIMKTTCPCCQGNGTTLSVPTLGNMIRHEVLQTAKTFEGTTIRITAHPTVIEFFRANREMRLKELERRVQRRLEFSPGKPYDLEGYQITPVLPHGQKPEVAAAPSSSEPSEDENPAEAQDSASPSIGPSGSEVPPSQDTPGQEPPGATPSRRPGGRRPRNRSPRQRKS